jgi:hypothetical protein
MPLGRHRIHSNYDVLVELSCTCNLVKSSIYLHESPRSACHSSLCRTIPLNLVILLLPLQLATISITQSRWDRNVQLLQNLLYIFRLQQSLSSLPPHRNGRHENQ